MATSVKNPAPQDEASRNLKAIREMVAACMQCGTCTASCPNYPSMDLAPRRLWRLAVMGLTEDIFASRTFLLCSNCYACTLRCPRGLPLTEAMAALKRMAAARETKWGGRKTQFYRTFLDNVRRWGRVQETDMMMRYFLDMKDPLLPLRYTPLGFRLLRKGKIGPPHSAQSGRLAGLFEKVKEMEARP
ncbi:MAG: heterodisulfide reductase subunit [Desulfovibrionales bacterium]|jgi:heterodisulfide reductase subunit C|nr:heterodisulfide reductase subunit [Desulfovibrionales bacterium]